MLIRSFHTMSIVVLMLLWSSVYPVATFAGTMTGLPGIDGADDIAWDINDDGIIVGTAYLQDGSAVAVRWDDIASDPEILDGPLFGYEDCVVLFGDARTITDDGTVVGRLLAFCANGSLVFRAATWDDDLDKWVPLPLPAGATDTWSPVANGNGDIAYQVTTAVDWMYYLYLPDTDSLEPIPGTEFCGIFALNNNHLATGFCGSTAMAWFEGDSLPLGGKNGDDNYGRGLNDNNTIVGVIGNVQGQEDFFHEPSRAAVWDLLQPNHPRILRTGWATDVNNAGAVVGTTGYNSDLSPKKEAAMWLGNSLTRLGKLGGLVSIARAINENGIVVGESDVGDPIGTFEIENGKVIEIYEKDAFIWIP